MSLKPSRGIPPERDAYGREIWACYKGVTTHEIVEREDGLIDIGSASPYFQPFENWPAQERAAIDRARSPVLDIGCGAGRVALYLQDKGHRVLAIDNSPLAVKVAKLRGVKFARVLSISEIGTLKGRFGSIVLCGNNFGLFGSFTKARRLLGAMRRITTDEGLIIAAASNPHTTRDPVHLAYQERNRDRGRMAGQIRLRVRYRQFRGPWFDYLFASPDEVRSIVQGTGWSIRDIVPSQGPGFVAILAKA
ncbi:MAG TPA: class I SAM-dependent methyltransferase [Verrucomicrobiae bacterium]|nr:class I SAM-dependent methyltransferase [Verrucomicrobiae bacterium]